MNLIRVQTDDNKRFTNAFVDKKCIIALNIECVTAINKSLTFLVIELNSGNNIKVEFSCVENAEKVMEDLVAKMLYR